MSCRIITCLVLIVFTFPLAEGQFPRVCTFLTNLKNKKCCPIPKGFSAPCGSGGNRGTWQEMIIRDWTFKFSHNQPFQKDDERHNWPPALYHKTCKCNSNFAGYDCSKCEFGYYDNDCTQKKNPDSQKFSQVVSRGEASVHQVHQHVQALHKRLCGDFDTIKWRCQQKSNRDPTALFHNVSNYDLFVWIHYYAVRDTNITWQGQILSLRMTGRGFLRGIDCTCWLGEKKSCRKLVTMKNFALPYWDWTGSKTQCDPAICSEELLGLKNQVDGTVKGKYFDNWYIICRNEQFLLPDEDVLCDPTNKKLGLI